MSMKIEVSVTIKDDEGKEIFETVSVEGEIPSFSEFTGSDNFREVFDKLERTSLKVRNESIKQAIENYSSQLSKKNTRNSRRKGKYRNTKKQWI